MVEPSLQELPRDLARAARTVADRLAKDGVRAWIVGGAVRDLILGRPVHDVDMVSAALPEQIEQAFEKTIPVGRSFGTVVLPMDGCEIQMATFRAESGYSDQRRPDLVQLGVSLEEDARRRDFTCNAMYLDPLTDELRDPEDGSTDLEAGILRTVGDPGSRFREDGLRLLRMARFEACLGLRPAADLHDAARREGQSLVGVSVERVLAELGRIFAGAFSQRAMNIMRDCHILERILPGGGPVGEDLGRRLAVHGRLPDPPGLELGLALWLEAAPEVSAPLRQKVGREHALELRASRELIQRLSDLWTHKEAAREFASGGGSRSDRILAMRQPGWADGVELALAWHPELAEPLAMLESWREGLSPAQLSPTNWITSSDLAELGLSPGPTWGELLREAERLQLDGLWDSRDQALAWLRNRMED